MGNEKGKMARDMLRHRVLPTEHRGSLGAHPGHCWFGAWQDIERRRVEEAAGGWLCLLSKEQLTQVIEFP